MDFSRLHTYAPPQCVPENTGYTYALSSSYSSDALDFETEHRLDPVFDSPRMSRRSLRLATSAYGTEGGRAGDADSRPSSTASLQDRAARTVKTRSGASRLAFREGRASRQHTSGQSSSGHGSASLRPPVLDESLIQEQTKVDHFWGLDDDGDLKGGNKAVSQGNGDLAADAAQSNGYTCRACSLLSERDATLPGLPASHRATSRVYSRDRSQKRGASFYVDRILWLATYTSSSLSSFLVQLFQVVLMKLNYESENYKLKSYESKDRESESYKSESHELKGEAARGTEHLGAHAASQVQVSGTGRAAGTAWPTFSRAGKAASGAFWWLGSGWYQVVALISWLNVFLLTRCLRNICKFLIFLIPLLLLLGAGLSLWGQGSGFLSLLPVLSWTHTLRTQRVDDPKDMFAPDTSPLNQPPEGIAEAPPWSRMSAVERQVASLWGQCQSRDQKLSELTASLQTLQVRVDRLDQGGAGLSSLVQSVVGQHLKDIGARGLPGSEAHSETFHHEHGLRISHLEAVLGKLAEKSEAIQKELEQTKLRTESGAEQQRHLLSVVTQLERELGLLQSELSALQPLKSSCEKAHEVPSKVEAQVRETVRLLLSADQQDGALDGLLRRLSAQFVSKDDLQGLLRQWELRILQNITHHISVTKQLPPAEAVLSAVTEEGAAGITEAQARVIVNNALKLYSQDKTGMVDFALESGGGSILSTRCSETYETKTALISLFGIPLWYFSQSPRVVIQPDMYPGNCWAFRGSQGFLVVRLSMEIRPTSFTLEHIPKTLSPTGNITSAPKEFSVYVSVLGPLPTPLGFPKTLRVDSSRVFVVCSCPCPSCLWTRGGRSGSREGASRGVDWVWSVYGA
uniref:Sad1 and UNC84 domain containing 1 n=1 Tax=Molossus molossus TaxID=27622 RepID=A0A7J8ICJ5_MOLMO|nr:Sad1 and UNC84 domain containing 1 [Molossus molossus]